MKLLLLLTLLPTLSLFSKAAVTPEAATPITSKTPLPSRAEIINTGHPLTLALYTNRLRYGSKHEVPDTSDLGECLMQHELLQSGWISEKGFIADIVKAVHQGTSPEAAILNNHKNFDELPMPAKILLMRNLMEALAGCLEKHKAA